MAFGPLTIFDKSFLQSLSNDEAFWFDNFFRTIITPLFFVETLADLEKEVSRGKTPSQVVGVIAYKTPEMNSIPNVHHYNLVLSNLVGREVEMRRRPIISGGIPKQADGGYGLYFDEFPELEALGRWQKEEFVEAERGFAKKWRIALENPGFETTISMVANIVPKGKRFSNLNEIKLFVDNFLEETSVVELQLLFEIIGVPENLRSKIIKGWQSAGEPLLKDYAPYANFVFSIDLFFYLGLAFGHIAKERASNKVDIAYLYYLPFSHIFVSNDGLHKRVVPFFLEEDQQFIVGDDVKPDLSKLNEYYDTTISEELKEQGVMKFANYPPLNMPTRVAELWDDYLPIWRKHAEDAEKQKDEPKGDDSELLRELNARKDAPEYTGSGFISSDDAQHVIISRNVRTRKGKWRTVPKSVEDDANKKK